MLRCWKGGRPDADSLRLTLDLMGRMMESLRLAKEVNPDRFSRLEPNYAKISAMLIQAIHRFCERGGRVVFIDPKGD